MKMRRDQASVHGQQGLDQPGDACPGLEMADVGFHRADQQGAVRATPRPKGGRRRVDFDWVADLRAGAVGLQIVDVRWLEPGPLKRRRDDPLLGRPIGNRQALARAVLVQR